MPIWCGVRVPPLTALACVGFSWYLAAGAATAAQGPVDLKTFVTRTPVDGIPYAQAHAYGSQAIPELLTMLRDRSMEEYWDKIIFVLGCIGDPAVNGPLLDFLKSQQGEISVQAFRATLAVLPALGHVARGGDSAALTAIADFTQVDQWQRAGLNFSYGRYRGTALGEVLGRTAIQGLGIAGTSEALGVLQYLGSDVTLRPDWRDNVDEAVGLNIRVGLLGAERAFQRVQP
jgi:hypothetical protein